MAAGHPKLKAQPVAALFLSRFAESEWRGIIRPWLEAGSGRLERAIVVAQTRGQTHALKQRCLAEGLPLLGVEFLTPGLSRKKRVQQPGLGRGLQVLVLRTLVEARLSPLADDDPARGFWKSLESDLESALDDFDELIRGGFGPGDFPSAELREVFGEFVSWVARHGYALAPRQDVDAGLDPAPSGLPPVAERLLVLAGGPEGWGEFFGLAALARRCASVTVVVAEPEFRGKGSSGEDWVKIWEAFLGVESETVDSAEPEDSCAAVGDLWMGNSGSAEQARVILGSTRSDEMERVAAAVDGLLATGADNVAVIFPSAGSANVTLARLLAGRGVVFADLVGSSGAPPVDTAIQRLLADFYASGCRLEELLALWPLLRSLGLAKLPLAQARQACQRLFDEVQAHAIEPHIGRLDAIRGAAEVARVARLLLPGWPESLPPAEALSRFEAARDRLGLSEPAGWSVLREFCRRVSEPMPSSALLGAIRAFLPEKGPAADAPGKGVFARVTLTTPMRAAGVAWSHVVLVGANSGTWPERREPSCWIGDEARRRLNLGGRFSLGLPTGDDRAALGRRILTSIARDTRDSVTFSAALYSEERPEEPLGPNVWLERVLWEKGLMSGSGARSGPFGILAQGVSTPPAVNVGAGDGWLAIWTRRRDPGAKFDEFFLGDPLGRVRPARLSAGEIEAGIKDPACLWFDAVLRVRRVGWGPFPRARRKSMGTWVHRVLASAMRGTPVSGDFFQFPDRASSEARLTSELESLRARWPDDRYWDSFHGDVGRASRELLARVYELPCLGFAAAEVEVPEGATIPAGQAGRVPVHGRMDLVLSDSAKWPGSSVEIVDFKTGSGPLLSARRMSSTGASLQLGVYLHAVLSMEARASVWMLKPEEQPRRIGQEALARASAKLDILGGHLVSGLYGARTPDRGEYVRVFEWPLACAPIAASILEAKFEATFGAAPAVEAEDADD